jgi:ATP-dependent protease Clp ATPase subunit
MAKAIACSFCGKDQDSIQRMVSSPDSMSQRAYICDECVTVCVTIFNDDDMNLIGDPACLSLRMRLARKLAGVTRIVRELPNPPS